MIASTVGPPHLATASEAVARAEEYVRVNGFVDPADADPKAIFDDPPRGMTHEAFISRRAHDLLPRACGVVRKVRDGFAWGRHVVFCYDPRKFGSGHGSNWVVQMDVVGNGAFIPERTPDNTSLDSPGITRLPGVNDFERLRSAGRPTSR
jgi:hypothetical protein